MEAQKSTVGDLSDAVDHFLPITKNFAPGLFHCYTTADLPRTNNDLEQCFGSVRAHERRATGRRGAIPGLVVRGSVRVLTTLVLKFNRLQWRNRQPPNIQPCRNLRPRLDI